MLCSPVQVHVVKGVHPFVLSSRYIIAAKAGRLSRPLMCRGSHRHICFVALWMLFRWYEG